MYAFILVLMAVTAPLVTCYDEKYDTIDVDKVIADETLFTSYTDCLLDKGPCDVQYSEDFKKLLPEVVTTACAKCSALQRQKVRKYVKAIQEKKPDAFIQFREKYDPKGEFEKEFAAFVIASD